MKQLYRTHLLLDYQLFKLNQSLFLPKLLPADVESTKLSLGCRVHQASLIVRDVNAITIPKDAHLPVSAKVARTRPFGTKPSKIRRERKRHHLQKVLPSSKRFAASRGVILRNDVWSEFETINCFEGNKWIETASYR